ncbi:MAG: HD domain-containing protein [Treponema sp.]|jgi:poly(A) polymerase|nr:HD domain-containing protein [Treponema sp.]
MKMCYVVVRYLVLDMGAVMGHDTICNTLSSAGYSVKLFGWSALDAYWRCQPLPYAWLVTDADISTLARIFDGLRFPGVDIADAALDDKGETWYFRCIDAPLASGFSGISHTGGNSYTSDSLNLAFKLLCFYLDGKTVRFQDPYGIYPLLRQLRDGRYGSSAPNDKVYSNRAPLLSLSGGTWLDGLFPHADRFYASMEGALILSRYSGDSPQPSPVEAASAVNRLSSGPPPREEAQRVFLVSLLTSPRPDLGFELLKASGFLQELWPELDLLSSVDHSKEYHPEGNVWNHTLETFRYRKSWDLRLSLGLLLHDIGKPVSASAGNRRFAGHAEIGAGIARKFLGRLGFLPAIIGDIQYLVKNHMLPAALKRLPLIRTEEIMQSPLFPTLMELYRCDESSSFKGLGGYYENSAAYQAYLKNRRNPYRTSDGKKVSRLPQS